MCIVALKHDSDIYFGCDTQVNGDRSSFSLTPKWIKFNHSIVAVSGDPYVKIIIEAEAPFRSIDVSREDVLAYILTLKTLLPPDIQFSLLIGGNNNLFKILSNYEIIEVKTFDSIGPGEEVAIGSLFSTNSNPSLRVEMAVRTAIVFKSTCGGDILTDKI